MLQKPNLSFVTSVTLKVKVMTSKRRGSLRGLWGSYIPSINLIAVKLLELSFANGVSLDRQMDGQQHYIICTSFLDVRICLNPVYAMLE